MASGTHDQGEALGLANRIAVMQEGCLVQQGTPEEIYASPTTEFVAGFIGDANMFPGQRTKSRVVLEDGPTFESSGADGSVVAVVRPDAMELSAAPFQAETVFSGTLRDRIYLGTHVSYTVVLATGREITVHRPNKTSEDNGLKPGAAVIVGWQPGACRVVGAG